MRQLGRALDCVSYLFLALQVWITINFRKNIKKNILNGYKYYLMTVCWHENIIRRLYIHKNQHFDGRLGAVIYSDNVRIKQQWYLFIDVFKLKQENEGLLVLKQRKTLSLNSWKLHSFFPSNSLATTLFNLIYFFSSYLNLK